MENIAIQEGDIVYLQSFNGDGYVGMEDFLEKDPNNYADSNLDNYVSKFYKDQCPHNFGMKCLFSLRFPGSEKATGGSIRFGSMVDIIHNDTQLVLIASLNATETQNSYKVCYGQRQSFNQFQHWQIVPKYKIRTEGEMIFDNDCVHFKSANKKLGELSVDADQIITTTRSLGFRIKIFRKFDTLNQENLIYSHSIIQLYIPEREAYLGSYNEEIQNKHIKNIDPSKLESQIPVVVQEDNKQFNCSTLFKIEYLQTQQCVEIKENMQVRLLNVQTAQYLTIDENESIVFQNKPNQDNIFIFEKIAKEKTIQSGDSIIQDALVKIKHPKANKYLGLQSKKIRNQKQVKQ